jgi:hypothetical protein
MFRREVLMLISVTLLLVSITATPLLASRPGEGTIYTSEKDIEFAQSILDGAGYLERGDYTVGRRDRATKSALADFQRMHSLRSSGWLDFDTMAMLSSHEPAPVSMARSAPPTPEPPPAPEPQAAAAPPPPPPAPEPPPPAPVVVAAMDDDMEMPATASPLPLLALSGGLLVGLGLLIMLKRPV